MAPLRSALKTAARAGCTEASVGKEDSTAWAADGDAKEGYAPAVYAEGEGGDGGDAAGRIEEGAEGCAGGTVGACGGDAAAAPMCDGAPPLMPPSDDGRGLTGAYAAGGDCAA